MTPRWPQDGLERPQDGPKMITAGHVHGHTAMAIVVAMAMATAIDVIIVVIRAPPKPHIFAVYSHKTLA